jgi:P pilus assembly chaperone PapD
MIAKRVRSTAFMLLGTLAVATLGAAPAQAEMVLSKVIVDLQPADPGYDDIEVWNDGPERMYVVVEPSEIRSPGLADEQRVSDPDPAVSGLLVTPQRLVLEPDQRRVVRISAVAPRGERDRIYRVTIKPVAGAVSADVTALKVLFGYDTLVLYRPARIAGDIVATHQGKHLTLRNDSNTAQELFDGKQCDSAGQNCNALPSARLYAGAILEQDLAYNTPVEYSVSTGQGATIRHFE